MAAPYGSWASRIGTDALLEGELRVGAPAFAGDALIWKERRPDEEGRGVLVRRDADGSRADLTPPGFDVRTRVHEYGGGDWLLAGGAVVFSNDPDGRLYRQRLSGRPEPITPEPESPRALRYADGAPTADGEAIVCVRESHGDGEPANEIVRVPMAGGEPEVIATGHDFYSTPRLSPDGERLAWLAWDHPRMPWDGTELWLADADGGSAEPVAGGPEESIAAITWSPDGVLHLVSDRSDWWNLYRLDGGDLVALAPIEAELAFPGWIFGMRPYVFLDDGSIACVVERGGSAWLGRIEPGSGRIDRIETERVPLWNTLTTDGRRLGYAGASATRPEAAVVLDPATGEERAVRVASELELDPSWISVAREISFPSDDGEVAHGLFYAPTNPEETAPAGELPPLLVLSHGGPTASASDSLDFEIQFWTSRGFAVVDVNYRGSSGYGRAYRNALRGRWGIVDLADCVAAAKHLAATGEVDGERLAIRGASAGGYTTLCALTMTDAFAAGASYFGVADAEALAKDTHKFESRYLDGLIGPYPEQAELYRERSPIHHVDGLSCPVILLQGLEDAIVPSSQAELMIAALKQKGIPYAYLAFEGEQHGFRRAESIRRAAEAELAFYGRIFGFDPADQLEPLELHNAPA